MIGQESLQKELFSYTLSQSPKTTLFLGEYGCGKHTLATEWAKVLSLPLVDITKDISLELLEAIQFSSTLTMYLINLDELTEQAQNMVLKFIEEPFDTAYVVLLSSNENRVIPTVLNRCYKCKFTSYTKEELEEIVGNSISDEVFSICKTPGQIRLLRNQYNSLITLCQTIATKMSKAPFSNALSIVDKINYKDEYDKFDLNIFLKVLRQELYKSYLNGNSSALKLYNIVCIESQKLIDFRLNREIFMQHLITVLWKEARKETQ